MCVGRLCVCYGLLRYVVMWPVLAPCWSAGMSKVPLELEILSKEEVT